MSQSKTQNRCIVKLFIYHVQKRSNSHEYPVALIQPMICSTSGHIQVSILVEMLPAIWKILIPFKSRILFIINILSIKFESMAI